MKRPTRGVRGGGETPRDRGGRGGSGRAGPGREPPAPRPIERAPVERVPDRQGLVVGLHAVRAVLCHEPTRARALWCWSRDREVEQSLRRDLARGALDLPWHDRAPEGLVGEPLAQGVALEVRPFRYRDLDDLRALHQPGALLLALDGITDTRNLGAILRSAAFFGVAGVIIPADRAAHVTPITERVARGGASVVPVAIVTNLARSLTALADDGWSVIGSALDAAADDLDTITVAGPTVLVLGAEDRGLRPLVRRQCQRVVCLQPSGSMESLNVSAFAAVALAALDRARRPGGSPRGVA